VGLGPARLGLRRSGRGQAAALRALRLSGTYSPITAQSRPIMMKKPENRAISPIPP
jgi:hypothetical protein